MSRTRFLLSLTLLTAALACLAPSTVQAATAIRTFVASTGNDTNGCTRTAPCRTFGAAIAQTTAGGDVIVLDSAGYGPVTINKSVDLVAPSGMYAGIGTATGNSITVAAGASDSVSLVGLILNGFQTASDGIDFTSGAKLFIDQTRIAGFDNGIESTDHDTYVSVDHSVVHSCYRGFLFRGASAAQSVGELRHSTFEDNHFSVYALAYTRLTVDHCYMIKNMVGVLAFNVSTTSVMTEINLTDSVIAENETGIGSSYYHETSGFSASGFPDFIRVGGCSILSNNYGLLKNTSGVLTSFGDNRLGGSQTADGTFTGSPIGLK